MVRTTTNVPNVPPYGRGQTLHFSRAKTTAPINTKFQTNDQVGQMGRISISRKNRFFQEPCGKNISLQTVVFLQFFFFSHELVSQRMLTCGGSTVVFWRKDVVFGCTKCYNYLVGFNILRTAPVGKPQPKRKRMKILNNLEMNAECTNSCNESLIGNQMFFF